MQKQYTLTVENCESITEFIEKLIEKKKSLRTTHFYSFHDNLPFSLGLTAMVVEEDNVPFIFAIPIRWTFNEEEACRTWELSDWFFSTWRRLYHGGTLVKALEFFFNHCNGDFELVDQVYTRLTEKTKQWHLSSADSIPASLADVSESEVSHNLRAYEEKMLWCRLSYAIGRYLEYGRKRKEFWSGRTDAENNDRQEGD